jgi:hypothetical protein
MESIRSLHFVGQNKIISGQVSYFLYPCITECAENDA